MHHPLRPVGGHAPRRATVRVVAGFVLGLSGLAFLPVAPALADDGAITTTLSGSQSLVSDSITGTASPFTGTVSVSADMDWSQPAAIGTHWDANNVRQGRNLDPTDTYTRPSSGTMHIHYTASGSVGIDAGDLGTLSTGVSGSLDATGACDLKAGGASYTCHLESDDVKVVDPTLFGVGLPYVSLKMVSDVTISPDALHSLRTASSAGQSLGTNGLDLGEVPVTDPLAISCKAGAGDDLTYGLGQLTSTPGVQVVTSVGLDVGFVAPTPVIVVPGFYVSVFSQDFPLAQTNANVAMSGPGGSVAMGTIKANNIAPSLGAVSAPSGVEGTPIPFATSATGPCADGATYSWDWGDGTGHGHTSTPQHTYADNGVYTGEVVVTDTTGLTDTKDFTVDVANANPVVSVLPGAPVTVAWGRPLTLKAQAVDPGAADQSTLTYDWVFGDGDSIDNGGTSATHQWAAPGVKAPHVDVCDKDGGCSTGNFSVTVRSRATTLAYTGPQAAAYSSSSPLSASLVDEFGSPVNNAPVVFSVAGSPVGTALTNASGVATLAYAVTPVAGSYTVTASYAGSALYDASGNGSPFVVSPMASTLTYTGGLSGSPNKATAVSAKVVDALGRPLPGVLVTFQIGSQSTTALTNPSGVAAGTIKLTQKPGWYPLSASWSGTAGKYLGDSVSAQFSLNKK